MKKAKPMSVPGNLSLADFYSADAESLLAKYRQIEHLIGRSHHGTSEGTFCEVLLKEFLRRVLPRHVSVDSGFIRRVTDTDWTPQSKAPLPADSPIASPQLDIIIHDSQNYAPLIRSEDFVVVLPEAVRAVIEVKKCLDPKNLAEAVANITTTTYLLKKWRYNQNRMFTCIFAFDLAEKLRPKTKAVSESFRNCYQKAWNKYHGHCELPYLIMALPTLAIQQSNPPEGYDYLRMVTEDRAAPNVAGQFLVFLLSHFTSHGSQGCSLPYPEVLRTRRQKAFVIKSD